jgi:hypothetical protein
VVIDNDLDNWRRNVAASRSRLSELEDACAAEISSIDTMLAVLFGHLREAYQKCAQLKLTVEYRTKCLAALKSSRMEAATEVERNYQEARTRLEKDYQEAESALTLTNRRAADEETELLQLWKGLVKRYHPDRFAQEPGILETYEKLASAINRAKDSGNLDALREIASDPNSILLRQGWPGLGVEAEEELSRLRQLFESLQLEIIAALESLKRMRESPEYELCKLVEEKPGWLGELLEERGRQLGKEIAELERQASQIARKIQELSGASERANCS